MPFGLTNAPATFQRIIDRVLLADLENHVMVYLDDIIIISKTIEEHMRILGLIFDRLREAGLVISEEKCHFCKPELRYLGYIVDPLGLRPDPEKVQASVNIPPPKSIAEIRRFIGTASWYRRFVPNFSTVLAPITNLTWKIVK
jgi:Reverse transcriptase (RNA-dependent DNA polymerase)